MSRNTAIKKNKSALDLHENEIGRYFMSTSTARVGLNSYNALNKYNVLYMHGEGLYFSKLHNDFSRSGFLFRLHGSNLNQTRSFKKNTHYMYKIWTSSYFCNTFWVNK